MPQQRGGGKVPPRRRGSAGRTAPARPTSPRNTRRAAPPPPPRARRSRRGRRLSRPLTLGIGAAILAAVAVVVVLLVTSGSSTSAVNYRYNGVKVYGALGPEGIPQELGSPLAPANSKLTGATVAGVECNSTEQLAFHHHVHVALFVNGQPRSVPLGIGMAPTVQLTHTKVGDFADGSSKCLYWLHVHAQDGIVHIESPSVRNFVLGQVFQLWNQPLSATALGPDKGKVTATVNGKPWTSDPTQIPLDEHSQIVINLGPPVVKPPPVSWKGTSL